MSAERAQRAQWNARPVPRQRSAQVVPTSSIQTSDLIYLSELNAVTTVSATDTTFWCTGGTAGCGETAPLQRVTAQQIAQWVLSQSSTGGIAIPNSALLGGTGTVFTAIAIDPATLEITGGVLKVIGGGTTPPATSAPPVTAGGGAPVAGGGGAPVSPGGAAALSARIAELEARIAVLEEK